MIINMSRQVVRRSHNDALIRRLDALEKLHIGVILLLYTRKGDVNEGRLVGGVYTGVRGNESDGRYRLSSRGGWTMMMMVIN